MLFFSFVDKFKNKLLQIILKNNNPVSKTHKRFSERLHNHRVLTNPEEFLGPNYEAVLNFWLILDELTEKHLKVIEGRYLDFYNNKILEYLSTSNVADEVSVETIGREFAISASRAALDVYEWVSLDATRELIGMHLLLEQQKSLTFFQMFLKVL